MDDSFLAYANNPFKEVINFSEGAKCLTQHLRGDEQLEPIESIRDIIAFLSEGKFSDSFHYFSDPFDSAGFIALCAEIPYSNRKKLIKEIKRKYPKLYSDLELLQYWLFVYDVAYQATFNNDNCSCCETGVPLMERQHLSEMPEIRHSLFGSELFESSKNIKCYECDQLHFTYILNEVVEGKEYTDIEGFMEFLYLMEETVKIKRNITFSKFERKKGVKPDINSRRFEYIENLRLSIGNSISEIKNDIKNGSYGIDYAEVESRLKEIDIIKLKKKTVVEFPIIFESVPLCVINKFEGVNPFRRNLMSAAMYSLTEFLIESDRRKLKKCPYCQNFFIAKSINRKTRCYEPNCERPYQREKKRKQRDKEPDIYY